MRERLRAGGAAGVAGLGEAARGERVDRARADVLGRGGEALERGCIRRRDPAGRRERELDARMLERERTRREAIERGADLRQRRARVVVARAA